LVFVRLLRESQPGDQGRGGSTIDGPLAVVYHRAMDHEIGSFLAIIAIGLVVVLTPRSSWLGRAIDALQGGDCDCQEDGV
jgi:hypothetical protein